MVVVPAAAVAAEVAVAVGTLAQLGPDELAPLTRSLTRAETS